jgi:hypothetical protein
MKFMENIEDTFSLNNQNSNIFGLSFSSQMNIGAPSTTAAEAVPTGFYYQPTPLHNYGYYYGYESEHGGLLYSALPIMHDGSQAQGWFSSNICYILFSYLK